MLPFFAKAQPQQKVLDSLHTELKYSANDTVKMLTLSGLNNYYSESNRDSAMYYIEKGIAIANKIKQPLWVAEFLILKAYILQKQSNYSLSFKLCNEALEIIQDKNQFFITLATVSIAAAGYVINDYFDVKIDLVNKPKDVIIGRYMKRRWAIVIHQSLSIFGVFLVLIQNKLTNNQ